jgi:hypothetical protein
MPWPASGVRADLVDHALADPEAISAKPAWAQHLLDTADVAEAGRAA